MSAIAHLSLCAALPVRIDNPGQLLDQHEGKTRGAGMFLSVSSAGLFSRLVPLVSKNGNGRNYQIVVPFNTSLTLVVHPSYYKMNDERGVALSHALSTKIPLLVPTGQKVTPIKFTISGAGNK